MSYVKAIIDKWDPIDLLAFAPKDEYHMEIERIEQLLGRTEDVLVLSEGIHKIFVDSFGDVTFQKSLSECTQIAEMLLSQKPRIQFVESSRALQIIEDCKSKRIRVLGIDGFKVTPTSTQPFMEHSVDYSDKKEAWDDAIAFVKFKSDLGLMFEVVCEDIYSEWKVESETDLQPYKRVGIKPWIIVKLVVLLGTIGIIIAWILIVTFQ